LPIRVSIKKVSTKYPPGYPIETLFQTRYHSTSWLSPCPRRHLHAWPLCTAGVPSEPTYHCPAFGRLLWGQFTDCFWLPCTPGSSLLSHTQLLLLVTAFVLFGWRYLSI